MLRLEISIRSKMLYYMLISLLVLSVFNLSPIEVEAAITTGRIAYADNATGQIWTMDADGSNKQQVTQKGGYDPAWSPNRDRLAFIRNGDVFTIKPNGTGELRLTRDKYIDFGPSWSPDGQKIVFDSSRGGQRDLFVINSTGGGSVALTFTSENEFDPDWSPDGNTIAFTVNIAPFFSGIAVMSSSGGPQTILYTSNLTVLPSSVRDPAWSPDGTQLAWGENDGGSHSLKVDGTAVLSSTESINAPAWSPDGVNKVYETFEFGQQVIKKEFFGEVLATNARQPDWGVSQEFPVYNFAPLLKLDDDESHFPMSAGIYTSQSSLYWNHVDCTPKLIASQFNSLDIWRLGVNNGSPYTENMYVEGSCTRYNKKLKFKATDLTRPYMDLCGEADPGELCKSDALRHKAEGFYIDPSDSLKSPNEFDPTAPAYYEFHSGEYIAYWFFYPLSVPAAGWFQASHDGDWEHIVVMLNSDNTPRSVKYYYHHAVTEKNWDEIEKIDSHPVVWVGEESHASYWSVDCNVAYPDFPFVTLDVCSDSGYQWETWQNLDEVTSQPWYGFGGAWGEIGTNGDTTAPLGPGPEKHPLAEG